MSWLTRSLDVLAKAGEADEMEKAALDADARNDLKDSDFALPGRRYPIHDASHARNALARVAQHGNADEQAKVKAAVHSRYPDIGEMEKAEVDIIVPIWKSEIEGKVWGVVLEPELPDSQQDIISKEEIAAACHDFMTARRADAHHSGEIVKADLIENFCAPCDFTLAGNPVREGSWVQGWQVHDSEVKDQIAKGELTGLSLHGLGVREAV